jgi:hypothetical protein
MSIFKNSKFSKATAYIASAGSLVPMLSKECSSVKVFAEGNDDGNEGTKKGNNIYGESQKQLGIFSSVLRWIISCFLNKENTEKAMVYLGILAKEQDAKNKEEGKILKSEEKEKGKNEEKIEDEKEKGLFRKGLDYVGSLIKGKDQKDKENQSEEEKIEKKDEKDENKGKKKEERNVDLSTIQKIELVCKRLSEVNSYFFYDLDCEKFKLDRTDFNYGFLDISASFVDFDLLESENCSFETDNLGDLTIRINNGNPEEKEELHLKVDENGMILVNLRGKYVPFRLSGKEFGGICVSSKLETANKMSTLCLIDVDKILSLCLKRVCNWNSVAYLSSSENGGPKISDCILKLQKIFEKKDKNGIFLERINNAIYIWKLLTPIVEELNEEYLDNLEKKKGSSKKEREFNYRRNFLIKLSELTKDKSVGENIRKMLSSAFDRLFSVLEEKKSTLPKDKSSLTNENVSDDF